MSDFFDTTYYFRELSKYLYEGYVPSAIIAKYAGKAGCASFKKYSGMHDYSVSGRPYIRKTANLPVIIGEYIVKNTYAEYPEITIKDDVTSKMLNEMFDDNDFARKEKELFETQIHLGGRFIAFYRDGDKFKLKFITGNRGFVTETKEGKPNGAVFITRTTRMEKTGIGNKLVKFYYTLLEWHFEEDNKRIVKNDLYRSKNESSIGRKRNDFIQAVFGELVSAEEDIYNISIPTFVYIKNPIKNNKDLTSVEGLGAFINPIDSLMVVDEAFHVMSKELVLSQFQMLYPEGATSEVTDWNSNKTIKTVDPYQEGILVFSTDDVSTFEPKAVAPQLRIQDQVLAFNTVIDLVATSVGIQAGSLRFDGKSFGTATEAKIQKGDTANTIKLYEANNGEGITDVIMMWQEVSNSEGQLKSVPKFNREDVTILWKDNVAEDDETMRENDRKVIEAKLAPRIFYWTQRGFSPEDAAKIIEAADADALKRQEQFGFSFSETDIDTNNPDGNNPKDVDTETDEE